MNYQNFINNIINENKQYYDNYKSKLFNLSYYNDGKGGDFIELVSLVPGIVIVNDNKLGKKITNKGKWGYLDYVINSFYNKINSEMNKEEAINRFFNEDYNKIKIDIIRYSNENGNLNKLKNSFNNISKILNKEELEDFYYDNWLLLKKELIENKDYISVVEDDNWLILIILNHDEYLKLCKNTKYCTRIFNVFYEYSSQKNDPLYLLIPKHKNQNNQIYQIHIQSNQFKDKYDDEVDRNKFNIIINNDSINIYKFIDNWNDENMKSNDKWNIEKVKINVIGFDEEKTRDIIEYLIDELIENYVQLKLKNNKLYITISKIYISHDIIKLIKLTGINEKDVYVIYSYEIDEYTHLNYKLTYNKENIDRLSKRELFDDDIIIQILKGKFGKDIVITNIDNIVIGYKIQIKHPELYIYLAEQNKIKVDIDVLSAIKTGYDRKIIKWLIENDKYNQPLSDFIQWSIEHNDVEIVELILNKGVDTNKKDRWNEIPLIKASSLGFINIVKLLLDRNADPNIRYSMGFTPLMYASHNGKSDVVLLLLERGAEPNIKNDEGQTALDLAKDNRIINYLLSKGAKSGSAL